MHVRQHGRLVCSMQLVGGCCAAEASGRWSPQQLLASSRGQRPVERQLPGLCLQRPVLLHHPPGVLLHASPLHQALAKGLVCLCGGWVGGGGRAGGGGGGGRALSGARTIARVSGLREARHWRHCAPSAPHTALTRRCGRQACNLLAAPHLPCHLAQRQCRRCCHPSG